MAGLSDSFKKIPLEDLEIEGSRFGFSLFLNRLLPSDEKALFKSLDLLEEIEPILVVKVEGFFNVLDGFKRANWARKRNRETIFINEVKFQSLNEIAFFLLAKHQKDLFTPTARALFLSFLKEMGVDEDFIIKNLMEPLGLGPRKDLFKKYLKISHLPEDCLIFCHQKGLSFKKCLILSHYPKELLNWLFSLKDSLAISASICLELLENINDIMRRDEIDLKGLLNKKEIKEILQKDLNPHQKTALFRRAIKNLRNPTLSKFLEEMDSIKRKRLKDAPIEIDWDRSLENRKITIKANLIEPQDLEEIADFLKKDSTKGTIKRLFSYL